MDVRVVGPPVLRVAAWPYALLQGFAAHTLAGNADRILVLRTTIAARSRHLTEALFRVVPELPGRLRRDVLALRRALHAGVDPVAVDAPVLTMLDAHDGLGRRIRDDLDERRRLAVLVEEFADAWAAEDRRQRARLHRIARSDRFRTALAVGNPGLYDAWERSLHRPGDSRRHTRLEHTLWRLLSRACARPTPQGLWSGTVHPGTTRRGPGTRFHVGVRLDPFRAAAEALAHRDPLHGPLRRDPTVHRDDDGWWWLAFGPDGPVWTRVPGQTLLDAVLTACDGGRTIDAEHLLNTLGGEDAAVRAALRRALRGLVDRGLLQPCAGLPGAAAGVWEALDAVTPQLPAADGEVWDTAVNRIRALCREMSVRLGVWPPERVREQVRACDQEVARLCAHAGVPGPEATVVTVDCEFGAEFQVTWTSSDDRAAEETIAEALAGMGADHSAERYRRASVADLAEGLEGLPPVPIGEAMRRWDAVRARRRVPGERPATVDAPDTRPGIVDHRFGARPFTALGMQEDCDVWEEWLLPGRDRPVHTLTEQRHPLFGGHGTAVLTADGTGRLAFHWGRPQPALCHSRHRMGAAAEAALRETLGGRTVEVIGRDCPEPAVAVRPDLTGARLDLTAAGPTSTDRWRVTVDGEGRVWCVDVQEPARLLMPVYNSAAEMGRRDPLGHLLWTAAMSHGWEWLSFGLPALPAERAVWRHHPEVRTRAGVRIGARRWTVPATSVAAIADRSGPDRYLAWREAVRTTGLPDVVQVRSEDPAATPLTVPSSSPLAVEALFRSAGRAATGSRVATGAMVLTPVSGVADPRRQVVDDERHEHVWEAAVAWTAVTNGRDATGAAAAESAATGLRPGGEETPALDTDLALAGLEALRAAGDPWVQCDLDLPQDAAGWSELRAALASWESEGLVTRWWFLHKSPGIRLRLDSPDPNNLRRAMTGAASPARLPGLRTTGAYEPETFRFGGPKGLELAHTHFAADSRMALSWRAYPSAQGTPFAALVGLTTAQTLFCRIAEDADELRDLWLRLDHALRTVVDHEVTDTVNGSALDEGALDGEAFGTALASLDAGHAPAVGDAMADTFLTRAHRWAARTGDAAARMRRTEGFPMRTWAAATVLFHWNRWALAPDDLVPLVRAGLSTSENT
ncbi:thiopeptide-type bacteriocin biosynthesis protein [Streptomyces sp. NPDC048604]|uniref:thiopeptide-type bacteriocin biosynthesis protein n=1 Tax=Streptomyces sp. NPDC048604 TaxID=3365578 RepID=UPI003714B618